MEHTQQDAKFQQMTNDPVEKLIIRLAIPSIVIMLISALYNMADTYFVGTLGTDATAGVGVVFSVMALVQAIGFFFGHGSGNYISRQLGAQNMDEASKMAAIGFLSALITVGTISVVCFQFLRPLARFLGATDSILPYAVDYLRYILLGAPFMAGSLMLNNLLRFQGSTFSGMIGMTTGAILNIGLDPLLIYVFDMGVAGAGLATAISQAVSCLILLICCTRQGNISIRLRNFKPSAHAYREILRGGTPSLCRQGIASISIIYLNQVAGTYGGAAAIAAISIVSRVYMFANSALIGFGQGFQPVCGFNYGAKRYDRVIRAYWFCTKLSTVMLVFIALAGFIFAPQVIQLFRKDDAAVLEIGALALRFQCITTPLGGWIINGNMMLQTIGKSARASVLAAGRQGLFLFPMLLILPPIWGILGIQLCQPLADLCTFILAIPLVNGVLREMKQAQSPATE